MTLQIPYQLGKLILPNNIFYAPLAGCSDFPFRRMSARYRPGLMFCEMVKMDPLVRDDSYTLSLLDYEESMRPIGAQICGSKVELAAASAKRIESLGFDLVDLNCGCPVDKVTKDGSGSGLLKTPEKIGEIISQMVNAVKIPVTVKIRIGWDEEHINAEEITKIAEAAGAVSIAIHGRTREQAYRGPARWEPIRQCKAAANKIRVVGNGDLFSKESVSKIFEETGCDAALIARGTMGSPWIVQEILAHLQGQIVTPKTHLECFEALCEHYEYMKEYHVERQVVVDMRRVAPWYIKNIFGAAHLRAQFNQAQSIEAIDALLKEQRSALESL